MVLKRDSAWAMFTTACAVLEVGYFEKYSVILFKHKQMCFLRGNHRFEIQKIQDSGFFSQ